MSQAELVARLEERERDLRELCGTIIATCRVNFLRGTLKSDDSAAFESLLNAWGEQMGGIGLTQVAETITREAVTVRQVQCSTCEGEMYYVGDPRHEREYRIEVYSDVGRISEEFHHTRCWNTRATPTTAEVDHVSSVCRKCGAIRLGWFPDLSCHHCGALPEFVEPRLSVAAIQSRPATPQRDITRLARETAEKIAKSGAFRFDVVNREAYREADLRMVANIIERDFTSSDPHAKRVDVPLTEVAVDRDCIVTFGEKDYQIFAGQSFTVMLGKICLTGPAERGDVPTIQQRNFTRGYEQARTDFIKIAQDERDAANKGDRGMVKQFEVGAAYAATVIRDNAPSLVPNEAEESMERKS